MKSSLFFYGAGSLGALLACALFWLIQFLGLGQIINMPTFPIFSEAWLYPKIIWGGLFSLCFLLPFMKTNASVKYLVFALLISLVELFVPLPFSLYKGVVGLNTGMYTFAYILIFNLAWALLTRLMLTLAR